MVFGRLCSRNFNIIWYNVTLFLISHRELLCSLSLKRSVFVGHKIGDIKQHIYCIPERSNVSDLFT